MLKAHVVASSASFYTYLLGTYYVREQHYHFLTTERVGNVPGASNILFLITTPKTTNSVLVSLMRKLREARSLTQGHPPDKRNWTGFGDCQTPEILAFAP